jgi:hypothetical protein
LLYENNIDSDVSHYTLEQKDILKYALNRNWGVPVFKLDNFVGNAQYTPFGKLRQFMLELKAREDDITQLEYKVEKLKAEIELEEEFKEQTNSTAQKKIHDINMKEKMRAIVNSKTILTMTYQERDKIMMLITRFNESPDGTLPDGRRIIDVLGDHEEEERLEAELWGTRLGAQAAYDLMFYGKVNSGNMEAIHQLPESVRQIALENAVEKTIITNQQLQIAHNNVMEKLQLESGSQNDWAELDFKQ